ncbi:MAG: hypothetical protein P9M13_04910 [Candidatus Ancaeobacter aquaticus]|nr:hypothetical protein [Candidatus Ancaeobacter aquaticus]
MKTILSGITVILLSISLNAPVFGKEQSKPTQIKKINVLEYHLPETLGTIKERHNGTNGATICYIQDAHCNFEAQNNNAQILKDLVKNYGFKLVAVEGSTGIIDTSPFAQFPDKDIKTEVATYFMKKGRITGPEYLSITTDLPFTIYGIENEDVYKENYDAFITTINLKDKIKNVLPSLERNTALLKQNIYSPELKEIDEHIEKYHNNTIQFLAYAQFLNRIATKKEIDLKLYPNFSNQNTASLLEKKIDFKKVDTQRGKLIDALSKKMNKGDITQLVSKSLSFRLGKIPAYDYYTYLKTLATKKEINMKHYKDLSYYIEYISILSNINTSKLIKECDALADAIKEKSFKNNDERTINTVSKNLYTLKNLFDLTLSPDDYDYFKNNKSQFNAQDILSIFNKYKYKYNLTLPSEKDLRVIDDNIAQAVHFYNAARKRDNILIDNTIKKMNNDGIDKAVLVTGGFHTDGIANILKEKGISYIIITPRITDMSSENPYLDVMLNKKTPFEELLMSSEPAK